MDELSDEQLGLCPLHTVIDCLADKWALLVLFGLQGGPQRFSQLRRSIPGVSQKMLSRTLKRLERDGLVTRAPLPGRHALAAYGLTPLGTGLGVRLQGLVVWARDHAGTILSARAAHDAAAQDAGANHRAAHGDSAHDGDGHPDA